AWQWQPAPRRGGAPIAGLFRRQAVAFRPAARARGLVLRATRLESDAENLVWRDALLRRSRRRDPFGAARRRRRLRQEPDPDRHSVPPRPREIGARRL